MKQPDKSRIKEERFRQYYPGHSSILAISSCPQQKCAHDHERVHLSDDITELGMKSKFWHQQISQTDTGYTKHKQYDAKIQDKV